MIPVELCSLSDVKPSRLRFLEAIRLQRPKTGEDAKWSPRASLECKISGAEAASVENEASTFPRGLVSRISTHEHKRSIRSPISERHLEAKCQLLRLSSLLH